MRPQFANSNVRARCPDCGGAVTTFESSIRGSDIGAVEQLSDHRFGGTTFRRVLYFFLRCAGCGRAGLAKIHCGDIVNAGLLEAFYPTSPERAELPLPTAPEIISEVREAEDCMGIRANRAASALLRSALEKTLIANGYTKGNLKDRIDEACTDGVITAARRQRAHDDIRVLGNDMLHDEWREVTADEAALSHHYVQRVLEDLYDDRPSVETILKAKGRLP